MARRNAFHNLALYHFISDFARTPMRDGPLRSFRLFASQRLDPTALVGCYLGWCSWTRRILEPIFEAQIVERNLLQLDPTIAPQSHRLGADLVFPGNSFVRFS